MGLCWKRGMERQDIVFIQGQDQKTFSFSKHLNHKYNNSRNILLIQICMKKLLNQSIVLHTLGLANRPIDLQYLAVLPFSAINKFVNVYCLVYCSRCLRIRLHRLNLLRTAYRCLYEISNC